MIKLNTIFSILLFAFVWQNASSTQSLNNSILLSNILTHHNSNNRPNNYYEEDVRARLEIMDCLVSTKIDVDVLDQVKRFVGRSKTSTIELLKRTEIYFPLIDKIFTEYDLPVELKYITIVESALRLDVKSHVGAAGIWQFMPATARILKLSINDKVDQRLDPVLSTHAAARYFKILYGMFGDWSLVLAAYNCGEYRVKDLLESTKAKDFWGIKKLLPRQTQLFVPAFIGASYMMQYYSEHNIDPELISLNTEKITFVKIHSEVNLRDLYKKTNITKDIFSGLNPSFKKHILPATPNGSYVSLPDSLMIEFVDYYMFQNTKNQTMSNARILLSSTNDLEVISFNRPFIFAPDNIALRQSPDLQIDYHLSKVFHLKEIPELNVSSDSDFTFHIVKSRESVSEIAENYKVDIEDLISWNEIDPNQKLRNGTVLKIKTY
jgi:membrane-bound lytic murein transglycosylase D